MKFLLDMGTILWPLAQWLRDSLGLPWSIKVTAANISDNQSDRRSGRNFGS